MAQSGGSLILSAVVLAAGSGTRFGGDKLQAELDGKPVLRHVLDGLASLNLHEIVVVGRARDDATTVVNPRPETGMGGSLALGIAALSPCDAAFVVLGDMPRIVPDLYRKLATALADGDICVPFHKGQNGHPVLFSARVFSDLACLTGDSGARDILRSGRYAVRFVEAGAFILADIDTPDDLEKLKNAEN